MTTSATSDQRLAVKYELWSDMEPEYRESAARIAAFQATAEIVGVLPFSEWVQRVPDYQRMQMLIAKVQDEVGHGHVMFRIAEDLGLSREQIIEDFLEGRAKLLNIFHYGFSRWEEIGPAALLMNSAAIVQFQSLKRGTYLPYARALKKIEKEESFHYHHAWDLTHELMANGTDEQRTIVQEAVEMWLPRLLAYFGPADAEAVASNRMYRLGLKVDSNDDLRQRWLHKIVPTLEGLGIAIPEGIRVEGEVWHYAEPDWVAIADMVRVGGPRASDWRKQLAASMDRNAMYRAVALRAEQHDTPVTEAA